MKKIPLTKGYVALVDDEDFEWLSQWKWHYEGGYACRSVRVGPRSENRTKRVWMHLLLLRAPDGIEGDHRNGHRLDNRKSNLRCATDQQNAFNRTPQAGSSRFKGVSWYARLGKWQAYINGNRRRIYLGLFEYEEDAALAYNFAAREHFGEFARLNEVAP